MRTSDKKNRTNELSLNSGPLNVHGIDRLRVIRTVSKLDGRIFESLLSE